MLLSEVTNPTRIAPVEAPIYGYLGPRKTIMITDDDPTQREVLSEWMAGDAVLRSQVSGKIRC